MISDRKTISKLIKEEILINSIVKTNIDKYKEIEENINLMQYDTNVEIDFLLKETMKIVNVMEEEKLIFENIDNLEDNFLKNLSEELEIDFDNINLEISSVSENIIEDKNIFNNQYSTKKLIESFNNTNFDDVKDIINSNLEKMVKNGEMFIEDVKFFRDKFKENKLDNFMTQEEKEKKSELMNKLSDYILNLNLSILFFNNNKNIDYLKDINNKENILKHYYSIVSNIAMINILMVIIRIIYTKISVDYSVISTMDYVESFSSGSFRGRDVLNRMINNAEVYAGNRNMDFFILNSLAKYINPSSDNLKLVKYLLTDGNMDQRIYPEFAKRMSLSYGYLHHIDNINKNISELLINSIGFTKSLTNKNASEIFTNFDFDNIKSSISKIKSFILDIYTDINSYTLGGEKLVNLKF